MTTTHCTGCPFLQNVHRFGRAYHYCGATGYWIGFTDWRPVWCLPVIQTNEGMNDE